MATRSAPIASASTLVVGEVIDPDLLDDLQPFGRVGGHRRHGDSHSREDMVPPPPIPRDWAGRLDLRQAR